MPSVIIRAYTPADRDAVRTIGCDTADRGGAVEHFFGDREIFADFLLTYYLEHEPTSTWIADEHGRVIGYVTGCLSSQRYHRIAHWRIIPRTVAKGILRGALCRAQTWALFRDAALTWLRNGFRREVPLTEYPAHLHVNVRAGFRGHNAGHWLVERFCSQVREAGLPGVHAAVREDNPAACAFFERMGFARLSRYPTWLVSGRLHHVIIFGKRLG